MVDDRSSRVVCLAEKVLGDLVLFLLFAAALHKLRYFLLDCPPPTFWLWVCLFFLSGFAPGLTLASLGLANHQPRSQTGELSASRQHGITELPLRSIDAVLQTSICPSKLNLHHHITPLPASPRPSTIAASISLASVETNDIFLFPSLDLLQPSSRFQTRDSLPSLLLRWYVQQPLPSCRWAIMVA